MKIERGLFILKHPLYVVLENVECTHVKAVMPTRTTMMPLGTLAQAVTSTYLSRTNISIFHTQWYQQ